MKFLVIDDSVPMRRIVQNVLARLGHTDVIFAPNGREALRRLDSETVDFVITDWFMPEMSGIEFVRTLRQKEATRTLPIMIVSANASRADVSTAVSLGVNGYVLKPFTADTLRERISAICDALSAQGGEEPPQGGEEPAEETSDEPAQASHAPA